MNRDPVVTADGDALLTDADRAMVDSVRAEMDFDQLHSVFTAAGISTDMHAVMCILNAAGERPTAQLAIKLVAIAGRIFADHALMQAGMNAAPKGRTDVTADFRHHVAGQFRSTMAVLLHQLCVQAATKSGAQPHEILQMLGGDYALRALTWGESPAPPADQVSPSAPSRAPGRPTSPDGKR